MQAVDRVFLMFAHRPSRHDPPLSHDGLYNKVGEMDLLIEGARAAMWKAAAEAEVDDPLNWAYKSSAARIYLLGLKPGKGEIGACSRN
jgi:hypothetical protein